MGLANIALRCLSGARIDLTKPGLSEVHQLTGLITHSFKSGQHEFPIIRPDDVRLDKLHSFSARCDVKTCHLDGTSQPLVCHVSDDQHALVDDGASVS